MSVTRFLRIISELLITKKRRREIRMRWAFAECNGFPTQEVMHGLSDKMGEQDVERNCGCAARSIVSMAIVVPIWETSQ